MDSDEYRHMLKKVAYRIRIDDRNMHIDNVVILQRKTLEGIIELLDIASRNLPEGELK